MTAGATTAITALFLVGPLVVVPIWLRLAELPEPAGAARLMRAARALSLPAGLALAAAFLLPPSPVAGILAAPWLAMAAAGALAAVLAVIDATRTGAIVRPGPDHAVWAALVFLGVSAGNALADRLGFRPFGFSPTIILLTAVHFTFAGFVLTLAGAAAHRRRPRAWLEGAIGLVVVGIPVTAVGFFGVPIAAWFGALLVSIGGLGIGLGTAATALVGSMRSRAGARLATVAGLALLLSMPLAAIYATGVWLGIPWLDVPAMVRTHGALNVLAFAVPVSIAWALERRATTRPDGGPADALDVLGFNVAPFVLAPLAGLLTMVVSLSWALPLPLPVRWGIFILGSGAVVWTCLAAFVIWRIFGADGPSRWAWIAGAAERPRRWLNVTTGFDDSTSALRGLLDGEGHAIDVFEVDVDHDAALQRARRSFPPTAGPTPLDRLAAAMPSDHADAVLLLMSGHEARGEDRLRLFQALSGGLAPTGRIVVVEHLRDAATILAFGPGAWHFARRRDWLDVGAAAGLTLAEERRLSPWVRGFVFERPGGSR